MQEQHAFPFLREIILFLVLAGILIPTLQRLRINQVLGFLAAGTLAGPFGIGLLAGDIPALSYLSFPRGDGVTWLGEVGVIFLMFMIGLELSAARLWAMRRWVFGIGSAQVLLSSVALAAVCLIAGLRMDTAIVLGLTLSLSSTAVVMQLMSERQSTTTPLGQATFSVLMLQDLAVVPLLILVGAMSGAGDQPIAVLAALAMAKAALAISLIYLVGGRLVHPLFRTFARQRQPDVFMALILLTTFGIAGLCALAGLSMALGALIAGLLIAETEFKHEVELMVEPFKGLLMGLFFMTVGMNIDLRQILAEPLWLAGAVLALVLLKAAVVTMLFRAARLSWGRALEGGLLLGQGGEFAFIVIGYATTSRLVDPGLGQRIALAVALSLFITPLLARLGRTIGERWQDKEDALAASADSADLHAARGRIIIAGFGRVGQQLAKLLHAQGIAYVAFENDARVVAAMRAKNLPVYFGNASRSELLRKVSAGEAPAIVLTMDNPQASLQAVRGIRREFPHVPLIVRSRDEKHASTLRHAGATVVVPETLEASLQISASVLESLGMDALAVDRIVDHERALFNAAIAAPAVRH